MRNMRVKEMDRIGEQMSVVADNIQWSPETAHLFRKTPPSVYPGFFDQQAAREEVRARREEVRTVLEDMPVFQGVVARLNQILMRTSAAREKVERELRQ
jgi:hypothetical protein